MYLRYLQKILFAKHRPCVKDSKNVWFTLASTVEGRKIKFFQVFDFYKK